MSNFTWADIYAPYARAAGAEAQRFVAELRHVLPPGDRDVSHRAGHEHVVVVGRSSTGHGREPGS